MQKRVLIVTANPDSRSLNGALTDVAVDCLQAAGHAVVVSDLYAMRFKAVADADDFPQRDPRPRLRYAVESRAAYDGGTQAPDVVEEQRKLLDCDALVLQFPLWWFSMPAIMKGWIDRVFANGFAYGLTRPGARYSARYGEGTLTGRRALVAITAGAQTPHFSERGVNGALRHVLFPITHGTLWYAGMDVLEPYVLHGANRVSEDQFARHADALRTRLAGLFTETPIPFRRQNFGDYDDDLCLLAGLEGRATGLDIHRTDLGDDA